MDSGPLHNRYSRKEQKPEDNATSNHSHFMVEEEEEDEETRKRRLFENSKTLPLVVFFFTFLFPPLGFIFFLMNKRLNPNCPRYIWFRRSLALGSGLSVLYTLIICSALHHTMLYKRPNDVLGYGYE